MRLSLNSSTIKPVPLLDKIRVTGEAGYKGIELWAVELYEHVGRGGEISDVEKAPPIMALRFHVSLRFATGVKALIGNTTLDG